MTIYKLLFVMSIFVCAFLAPADAELITIAISGQVTDVRDEVFHQLQNKIHIGDIMTGTYTYDSSTPDSLPSSSIVGSYEHHSSPAGISVSIGDFNFSTNPNNVFFSMNIGNNDLYGADGYYLVSGYNLPLSNGAEVNAISWQLNDSTGMALSSDVLPTSAPNLSVYQSPNVLMIAGECSYLIKANVTSAVLVPEPCSIFLLIAGFALYRRVNR